MNPLKPFEVISLDMFQTLVNVNSRREYVWRPILNGFFTSDLAEQCGERLLELFWDHSNDLRATKQFHLTQDIYKRCFESLFKEKGMTYDPLEATRILINEHTHSELYEDTVGFLEGIVNKYKVCIVSDTDEAMLPKFYLDYRLRIFTSEQYQSYKNDDHNAMFKQLLLTYRVNPSQVIHIGDSISDVVGAKREGIVSCWLNRERRSWGHEVKPDLVIHSLGDLDTLL